MELALIICIICLAVFSLIFYFIICEMKEEFKYLTYKVNLMESKMNEEPEQKINIDYQNLNQEL